MLSHSRCKNLVLWSNALMLKLKIKNRNSLLKLSASEHLEINFPRSKLNIMSANEITTMFNRTWTRKKNVLTKIWATTWLSTRKVKANSIKTIFRPIYMKHSRRDSQTRQNTYPIPARDCLQNSSRIKSSSMQK